MNAKDAIKMLGITNQTLYNYRKAGLLTYTKVNEKKFIYDEDSIRKLMKEDKKLPRVDVTYSRVSQLKQKKDLEGQTKRLYGYCISNGTKVDKQYQDIKSGMSFRKRTDFVKLLGEVFDRKINTVTIENKDRLCRFGFELLEVLFEKFGTKIIVASSVEDKSYEQEMTDDLIAIIHHFSTKSYSNRRKLNKIKEELKKP